MRCEQSYNLAITGSIMWLTGYMATGYITPCQSSDTMLHICHMNIEIQILSKVTILPQRNLPYNIACDIRKFKDTKKEIRQC